MLHSACIPVLTAWYYYCKVLVLVLRFWESLGGTPINSVSTVPLLVRLLVGRAPRFTVEIATAQKTRLAYATLAADSSYCTAAVSYASPMHFLHTALNKSATLHSSYKLDKDGKHRYTY